MTRKDNAQQLFLTYNCAQATVGAFTDVLGMDEKTALRLTSGLGSGVGGTRLACGTFVGAALVLGSVYADESGSNKAFVSAKVREFAGSFAAKHGSLLCSDLLPRATANRDPSLSGRPCLRYVLDTVDLLTQMLGLDEVLAE
ncbi:MAG: C_GCAxxG_C_C family protein [Clostridia bacterium]|nr:C_GCAxxG_C_C family protein [Clostridia bacterium]